MNFCRTSLINIKKLMQSLADADVSVSAELRQLAAASANPALNTLAIPQTPSSTVMALGQLGLLDRTEAGSNLSV